MTYEHGAFEYAYERSTGAYSSFDRGVFACREPLENRRLYVLSQQDEQALSLAPVPAAPEVPDVQHLDDLHPVQRDARSGAPAPRRRGRRPTADARSRRRERLEYLSYACGHTLVDQLTAERIERGEGISHLFE